MSAIRPKSKHLVPRKYWASELVAADRKIRTFSPNHPAKEKLLRHAACRKQCVGREITQPGRHPVHQEWFSKTDQKERSFSGIIYEFICYNSDYRAWTETFPPNGLSEEDRGLVKELPRLLAIIDECKSAAKHDQNTEILNLLTFVEAYLEAACRCTMSIVEQRLIPVSEKPEIPFVNQVLNLR